MISEIISKFKSYVNLQLIKRRYRRNNAHNDTSLVRPVDSSICNVGNFTYGPLNVFANTEDSKIFIGHFCSIAGDVEFILSADHYVDHISTFPFKAKVLGEGAEAISKGDIVVDDDVWIGQRATILSGVHIGQGAIIAAGAVVTKDVPPYAVFGGVPARLIKYRFSPTIIEKLLNIDYSKLSREMIAKNIDKLYESVTEDTDLSWLPKKG